jgi:hypothetical protein
MSGGHGVVSVGTFSKTEGKREGMNGYWGKILRVDLSTGEITVEEPPESFYRRYLGGSGLIGYYLLKEVPIGAEPLGPENLLIFAAGPITGVPIAGAGRNAMGAKSPLTGGYGEADVGGSICGCTTATPSFVPPVISGVRRHWSARKRCATSWATGGRGWP